MLPTAGVLLVAIVRNGRPRLGPYLAWAFAAGLWGAWMIVAQQMVLAFFLGLLVGWVSVGWKDRMARRVRRQVAGVLLRWANRLDPDRPWTQTS